MKRRVLGILFICLLVAVAGCAGLSPDSTTDADPTPSDEDPTPADDATNGDANGAAPNGETDAEEPGNADSEPGDLENPPGMSNGSITDPDRLLTAHQTTLANTSATVSYGQWYSDEYGESGEFLTGESDPESDAIWVRIQTDEGYAEYYSETELTHTKHVSANTTRYFTQDAFPVTVEHRYGADEYVAFLLMNAEYEREGTATHDGEPVHWFTATELESNVSAPDEENVSVQSDGELLVAETGVIRHGTIEQQFESEDGETATVMMEVTHRDIGNTEVEQPDWVEESGQDG